jgi:hypothetical protein
MRVATTLFGIVAFLIASAELVPAVGKSRTISYLASVHQLVALFNRIYLTEYFSTPTDIPRITFRGARDVPPAEEGQRRYCADLAAPSDFLVPKDGRYALRTQLSEKDVAAWPLGCIPVKHVKEFQQRDDFLRSGRLSVSMLNLVEPDRFVDRIIQIVHNPQRLSDYALTKERYLALYMPHVVHSAEAQQRVMELAERNMPSSMTFDLEGFVWRGVDPHAQYRATLSLLDPTQRPTVKVDGYRTVVTFGIRPFN